MKKKNISSSRKNNFDLMKLFSFRTIRRLTTHKATKEFVETTEFRDGAEKREGKTGVNWFIDWSVT